MVVKHSSTSRSGVRRVISATVIIVGRIVVDVSQHKIQVRKERFRINRIALQISAILEFVKQTFLFRFAHVAFTNTSHLYYLYLCTPDTRKTPWDGCWEAFGMLPPDWLPTATTPPPCAPLTPDDTAPAVVPAVVVAELLDAILVGMPGGP
uniref:Uncharacterized protein n=1 Tax=Anopheles coluzzii TaxID=1518534 RepID=A0A8W7PK28_ANOCL